MSLAAFKVFITVTYNGPDAPATHKTIRRFSAKPGTTLAEFRKILIEEILRYPETSLAIAVSYKDADGDVVEVASELEWAEALQQHSGAVAAGTAIPILVDVKMDAFTESNLRALAPSQQPTELVPQLSVVQPADVMSQFSPIDPSGDEYSDSDPFGRTTDPSSESSQPLLVAASNVKCERDVEQPQAFEDKAKSVSVPIQDSQLGANEDQRQPQTEEDALALPQPSTDALMLENETSPSTPAMLAPNGWEEINADEEIPFEGEEIEMTSVTYPTLEDGTHTSEPTVGNTSTSVESQESQNTPIPQPSYPQAQSQGQQQQQQFRPNLGFFAAPLAWLSMAQQQLSAQPRANNRYPRWQVPSRGSPEPSANPINNGVGFAATVARYQKRTGATKAEDTVRLLALCPNATAQQAQEALEKYNGQVYRAANYLLDITSAAAAPSE